MNTNEKGCFWMDDISLKALQYYLPCQIIDVNGGDNIEAISKDGHLGDFTQP